MDSNTKSACSRFEYNSGGTLRGAEDQSGAGLGPRDEDAEDGNAVLALLKATSTCIVSVFLYQYLFCSSQLWL